MKKGIICAVLALLVVLSMAGVAAAENETVIIILDDCGGTGGPGNVTATTGVKMPKITSIPTLEDHNFAGYFDLADGGNQYYSADGFGLRNCDLSPGATLYAHWISDVEKTNVDLTVNSEYTWTAPSDITLVYKDTPVDSTLTVSKLVIPTNKMLKIVCASANATVDTFRLYNEKGGSSDSEKYLRYTYVSATPGEFTNHTLEFRDPITDTPEVKTLKAMLTDEIPAGRSGTWSDTLTFTATIVEANTP